MITDVKLFCYYFLVGIGKARQAPIYATWVNQTTKQLENPNYFLRINIMGLLMKKIILCLALGGVVLVPFTSEAGCDYDIKDADLIVAEQMSEEQILALIQSVRVDSETVEQAEKPQ